MCWGICVVGWVCVYVVGCVWWDLGVCGGVNVCVCGGLCVYVVGCVWCGLGVCGGVNVCVCVVGLCVPVCVVVLGVCVEGGVLVFFSLSRVFGTLRKGRAREHVKAS